MLPQAELRWAREVNRGDEPCPACMAEKLPLTAGKTVEVGRVFVRAQHDQMCVRPAARLLCVRACVRG
jgi:hypothetical protein